MLAEQLSLARDLIGGHKVKILSLMSGFSNHGGDSAVMWLFNPNTTHKYGFEEMRPEGGAPQGESRRKLRRRRKK